MLSCGRKTQHRDVMHLYIPGCKRRHDTGVYIYIYIRICTSNSAGSPAWVFFSGGPRSIGSMNCRCCDVQNFQRAFLDTDVTCARAGGFFLSKTTVHRGENGTFRAAAKSYIIPTTNINLKSFTIFQTCVGHIFLAPSQIRSVRLVKIKILRLWSSAVIFIALWVSNYT